MYEVCPSPVIQHIDSDRFNIDRLTADIRTNLPICLTRMRPSLISTISTSTVGIATRNGLNRPGIESSRPEPGPFQPPL